jgi:hypothetical protein
VVGDSLVHFVIPTTSLPVLYVMLVRLGLVRDTSEEQHPRHRLGLVFFANAGGPVDRGASSPFCNSASSSGRRSSSAWAPHSPAIVLARATA